jgi:hypothetical protein
MSTVYRRSIGRSDGRLRFAGGRLAGRRLFMAVSMMDTGRLIDAYLEALVTHGDYAQFFSDDVVAILEGPEIQEFRGREAVREWIDAAHELGEIKILTSFGCEAHAAAEAEFVRKDGVAVPYSVIYDFADDKITALRLFFTGPIA